MCNAQVFLVGRIIRTLHEVGLHAQSVRQWPMGEQKAREWAHVCSRYFEGRHLLDRAISVFLDPIEAEIVAVSLVEMSEMEGTLQDRLPKALAIVEAARNVSKSGPRGGFATDHALLDDIPAVYEAVVTLAALVKHILTHFQTNPFPVNPNVGFGAQGAGGVALIDERDDPAVIEHIRGALASGAFSEALDPSRSTVASRDIPIEDRGRTNQYVGDAPSPSGLYEPGAPGSYGASVQWLTIAMWAVQAIPQLVELIKQLKTK